MLPGFTKIKTHTTVYLCNMWFIISVSLMFAKALLSMKT